MAVDSKNSGKVEIMARRAVDVSGLELTKAVFDLAGSGRTVVPLEEVPNTRITHDRFPLSFLSDNGNEYPVTRKLLDYFCSKEDSTYIYGIDHGEGGNFQRIIAVRETRESDGLELCGQNTRDELLWRLLPTPAHHKIAAQAAKTLPGTPTPKNSKPGLWPRPHSRVADTALRNPPATGGGSAKTAVTKMTAEERAEYKARLLAKTNPTPRDLRHLARIEKLEAKGG